MHVSFSMVSMTNQCSGWKLTNLVIKSAPLGKRDGDGMGEKYRERDGICAGLEIEF